MDVVLREFRHAVRSLLRSKGFAIVAVLTLALGIGATTAIFSVVRGVLLEPLPYPGSQRLVQLWQVNEAGRHASWSEPNLRDVAEQSRSFAATAAYGGMVATVGGAGDAERVPAARFSETFFDVLAVPPARGRLPSAEEHRSAAPVVVVGDAFWRSRLDADPAAVGRALTIDERSYTIVGVLPPGLEFPAEARLWVPRTVEAEPSRTAHNWRAIGRLAEGVTVAQARQELTLIAERLKRQHGDDTWMAGADAMPLRDEIVGDVRPALLLLLGAAGLLLLVACANVANLLLARVTTRARELAVRLALGAGAGRLVRQFLAESLVLAVAGGAGGVLLAIWGVDALLALEPGRLPRPETVGVDWMVLAAALLVSIVAALGIGLAGALRALGSEVRDALADRGDGSLGGRRGGRLRAALVGAQVALTLVLLIGAGLLGRSFVELVRLDPGYRTADLVALELSLPAPQGPSDDPLVLGDPNPRGVVVLDEALARLRALPGVEAAGAINAFPLSGGGADGQFIVMERPDEVRDFDDFGRLSAIPERTGYADYRVASPGYFEAMRIPLLRGRLFEERDAPQAPHVAVVSRSLAEQRWPGEDPVGKLLQFGNMDGDLHALTVVGVVGDVRDRGLETAPGAIVYANARQRTTMLRGPIQIAIGGPEEPAATIAAARQIAREVSPGAPVRLLTIEELLARSLASRRFSLVLLGVFGACALLLAAMGIYGVVSYVVSQRTREIGIRMALGADRAGVSRGVVHDGLAVTLVGIGVGMAGAYAATRLLAAELYGVAATDPATFAGVALVLVAVAALASWVPARRAAKVDPMVALRME